MIIEFNNLLTQFMKLDTQMQNNEQTFMQITRYPHLENVCSNILAFYFNTEEAHGFRNLFIRSLFECIGIMDSVKNTTIIERELQTAGGNRIDIYIETDDHLIAIENKVYSGLNNPLADYEAQIHRHNTDKSKKPVFILLTLWEERADSSAFVNVTYSQLFKAIRKNMGDYVVTADTKWIMILNDFIRTIEALREGNELDREFIEFYNENEADIQKLLDARLNIPKALKAKLSAISHMLDMKVPSDTDDLISNNTTLSAEYYISFTGVGQFDAPVVFEIYLDRKTCEIIVGIDGASSEQQNSLKALLTANNLSCQIWDKNSYYFLVKVLDTFDANDVIAREFQDVLNRLVFTDCA